VTRSTSGMGGFGDGRTFAQADLEVPVLAKDPRGDVPICYCFGWTRDSLGTAGVLAVLQIRAHIAAGRCGCEVNNPRCACCLGEVERLIRGS
jgi:hypothetical protein